MSFPPVNQLVFAGSWSALASYPQFQFVISPIDGSSYVNGGIQPSIGGPDPSVQPSAVWVSLNGAGAGGVSSVNALTGDVGIVAGDGTITVGEVAGKISLTANIPPSPSVPTIQYGTVNLTANAQSVVFPSPFTVAPQIFIQPTSDGAGVNGDFSIGSYGRLNEFQIFYTGSFSFGPLVIFWMAIGT